MTKPKPKPKAPEPKADLLAGAVKAVAAQTTGSSKAAGELVSAALARLILAEVNRGEQ